MLHPTGNEPFCTFCLLKADVKNDNIQLLCDCIIGEMAFWPNGIAPSPAFETMCKLISLLTTRQQQNVNMQVIVKPPDMIVSQTAYSLEF